jgi:hypothetical protein
MPHFLLPTRQRLATGVYYKGRLGRTSRTHYHSKIKHQMTNILTLATTLNSNVAKTRGRFTRTRQDYINALPTNAQVYANEDGVVIYKYVTPKGNHALLAFSGRSNKPDIHSAYLSEDSMKKSFGNYIEAVRSRAIRTQENKERMNRPSELSVGDILYTSWGYDQTNVEFFQVIKTVGKRTVEICEIHRELSHEDGLSSMAGYVTPVKDSFIGKPSRHVVSHGTQVSFNSYRTAWKWDGKRQYCSWYA